MGLLELARVTTPMGLVVDRIVIDGRELSVESEPFAVASRGPLEAEVVLAPEDVSAFVGAKAPPQVKKIELEFLEGAIRAIVTVKVIFDISASATLGLRIAENRLEVYGIDDSQVPAPARPMLHNQLASMNPLFDPSSLPFEVRLTSVAISAEGVRLRGQASLP
ncbi:MAG: hypothetical protein CNCCGFBP_02631 [Fimbriimonadaceae bacterium]|nr:hypothetical protein [Fimbriimonadaceae bacterium]